MKYAITVNSYAELLALGRARPRWCTAVELDGAMLAEPDVAAALKVLDGFELRVRDLMPRRLCGLIAGESGTIREEFITGFHRACRRAAELGASEIELAFRTAPADASTLCLLHSLYGVLYSSGCGLRFPFRLPKAPGDPADGEVPLFLRELMFDAELTLELHVHEPAYALLDISKIFSGPSGVFTSAARLIYEPLLGNRLSGQTVRAVAASAGESKRVRQLIFAPGALDGEAFENELHYLSELLEKEEFASC